MRSRWRGKWLMLALVLAGLSAGANAPGLSDFLARLPLFDIAINERLIFASAWGFCVLAALGLDRIVTRDEARSSGLVLAGVLGLWAITFFPVAAEMRFSGLEAGFIQSGAVHQFVPLALAALACLTLGSFPARTAVLLFLLLIQRGAEAGKTYPTLSRTLFYPAVSGVSNLKGDGTLSRGVGTGFTLVPNMSSMYGIEDARGWHGMTFRRHAEIMHLWSVFQPVWFNRVDNLSSPFLSVLNIRYAMTASREKPPEPWSVVYEDPAFRILENGAVFPRAFVPEQIRFEVRPRDVVKEMGATLNFRRRAWINLTEEAKGSGRTLANGPGRVRLERKGLGYRLHADMKSEGWVVISETAWKGWRAWRGTLEVPVAFANHAFLGVHLPAGTHEVRLRYFPRSFVMGGFLSLLTITGLACAGVWRWMRKDKIPEAESP